MIKKFIYLSFILFLFGCKSNPATKLDMKSEVNLKGNWTITNVIFPGSDYFKIKSFDIDDSQCFVGSQWKFVSNNNTGEMILTNGKCKSFGSQITWFVNKEGNFVMKFINQGMKAKNIESGYVLKLKNISENSFQLIDKAVVGNNTAEVIYQFSRIVNE